MVQFLALVQLQTQMRRVSEPQDEARYTKSSRIRSLDCSSSRSCHSPHRNQGPFRRVHMFPSYEEYWFSSLSQFIEPAFKHLMKNNFILVIKYIDSCTEGGCFLWCCFCNTCFMCIFTHMTFTSPVTCKCPIFSLKKLVQTTSPHEVRWSFRHFVKCGPQ